MLASVVSLVPSYSPGYAIDFKVVGDFIIINHVNLRPHPGYSQGLAAHVFIDGLSRGETIADENNHNQGSEQEERDVLRLEVNCHENSEEYSEGEVDDSKHPRSELG